MPPDAQLAGRPVEQHGVRGSRTGVDGAGDVEGCPAAPIPVDRIADPARLAELFETGLLRSGTHPGLDRLTRTAARVLHVPTALVSLVDLDEQVFASQVGLGQPWSSLGRTPLTYSFCKHVVHDDAPLVITDAPRDSRVSGNPAVEDLGVVAYAGFPLRTPDGRVLGSFCVIDTVVREWTTDELALLHDLAGAAESEIALRLANRELLRSSSRMRRVLDTAGDAFVSIDAAGTVTAWNASAERLFGYCAADAIGRPVADLIIPPRLRAAHERGLARVRDGADSGLAGQRLELTAMDRSGREFPVEMAVQMVVEHQRPEFHAFLHDITQRRLAQHQVEHDRTFLQALLDSLDTGVVACDAEGSLTMSNLALRQLHPHVREPVEAATWAETFDLLAPDGHTPLRPDEVPLARAFAGETVEGQHVVVRVPDTRPRRLIANGRSITTGDGRRLGAVVALHDITEQHRAECLREAQLAVARALADATTAGQAAAATVRAVATAFGWTVGQYWHPDPATGTLVQAAAWTAPGADTPHTHPGCGERLAGTVLRTGEEIWVADVSRDPGTAVDCAQHTGVRSAVGLPVRSGEPILGVLLFFTTTVEHPDDELLTMLDGVCAHLGRHIERCRAEQLTHALAAARQDFDRVVGLVNDYVWTVEMMPDGTAVSVYASPDGRGVFGDRLPVDTDMAAALAQLVHPDDALSFAAFHANVSGGRDDEVELRLRGVDGVVRWIWTRAVARREGDRLFVDGISTNITERRHLAEQRERLLAEQAQQVRRLQELDQLKDDLVALVSHELRNPLGAIRGYIEMLRDAPDLDDEHRRFVTAINRHSGHMQRLVDDLLDMARLDAGQLDIDPRPVALARLVREAVQAQQHAADGKQLRVRVDIPGHLPVHADPMRLRQVLDNLLSNAIKYTPPGGAIEIAAHRTPADNEPVNPGTEPVRGPDTVVLRFTDSGIGIPADQYPQLFNRFFRASNAVRRGIKGTGLGLAISKAIIEAHGGTLGAQPASSGTAFTITLPCAAALD